MSPRGAALSSARESKSTVVESGAERGDACPVCGGTQSTLWLQAPDRFHLRSELYSLYRCSGCSLVKLADVPEDLSYHYGKAYDDSIQASGENNVDKRWALPRERCLSFAKKGALLDIGCSAGAFLRVMKSEGWELSGIEMSPEKARHASRTTGANVFIGDILDAPFAPQSFDVITGLHVMEHVQDPQAVMRKLRDWLKPGGIAYFQVPNIEAWEARLFRSYWYGLELPRHLSHFTVKSLETLGSQTGFDVAHIATLPDCYIEKSIRYAVHKALGVPGKPLSEAGAPGLAWRLVRKAFRLGVLLPFRNAAAKAGRGAAIEVAFRKGQN